MMSASATPFEIRVGLENLVGRLRIDVVGTGQNPALDALFLGQIVDGRDGLLVRSGTRVKDVARGFFTLVLDRVEQDRIQLFEDRQDRLARRRGPATENGGNLVLRNQLAGLFGEQRPVGSRVDDDGFELLAEHATLLVLLGDEHQHDILEGGLRDGHGAGKRVQNTDLDGVVSGESTLQRRRRHYGSEQRATQFGFECHWFEPLFSFVRNEELNRCLSDYPLLHRKTVYVE
jgi:hypothetical protein